MEKRKMFSLNLIAYIISKRPNIKYDIGVAEDTGNVYFSFDDDVSNLIKSYKYDRELQKFIESFNIVRNKMKQVKM